MRSGRFGAGFGEGDPLVAEVGDDLQAAAEGFDIGSQGASTLPHEPDQEQSLAVRTPWRSGAVSLPAGGDWPPGSARALNAAPPADEAW